MKKLSAFLLVFSTLIGDPCGCPPLLQERSLDPAYNASNRIEVDHGIDMFGKGGLFFWEATQSNMELGIISNQADPRFFLNGNIALLDFSYQPGFTVALGVNLDRDGWDAISKYTLFRSTVDSKISLDAKSRTSVLFPSWQIPDILVSYYEGQEKWSLCMDFLDAEMGRSFYVGSELSYRFFFGARLAWISQKVKVEYENVTSSIFLPRNGVSVEQKSSSWAIGPRTGLETNWPLWKKIRVYENGSFDILFTKYPKLKFYQEGKDPSGKVLQGSLVKVFETDDHHLRGHTDLEFGIGWGTFFAKKRWHTDLTLGYQFQIFFDQNMFRTFIDDQTLGKADSPHGNLYIHGLTLQSRWDF